MALSGLLIQQELSGEDGLLSVWTRTTGVSPDSGATGACATKPYGEGWIAGNNAHFHEDGSRRSCAVGHESSDTLASAASLGWRGCFELVARERGTTTDSEGNCQGVSHDLSVGVARARRRDRSGIVPSADWRPFSETAKLLRYNMRVEQMTLSCLMDAMQS